VVVPAPSELIPNPPSPLPGLYVHVPFCSAICNYCNFNRGLFDETLKARFVAALLSEIREKGSDPFIADTLYFGGGTPSLLTAPEIKSIIDEAHGSLSLASAAEITLEANPETVDQQLLDQFRDAGVNRLSFGVQSFRDAELKRLGRLHSAARARHAIEMARVAGFENVSLDLMMWLPGQNVQQWLGSVEEAVRVGPDHVSLYILEVYPHLPLKSEMDRHGWRQEPDEIAADMYETAMSFLDAAGYVQYEISNVCKPGRHSRHNLKYWTDGEWVGFGPGAHSTRQGSRWRNISSTEDYVQRMESGAAVTMDRRSLSNDEQLGDALFTGLRLNDGVDVDLLSRRYGIDVWERFAARLMPFCDAGILLRQDGRLRLTRRGMLLANEVMSVFV
jgi:oxygen-independent coproporphyrinogen III oxidase